MKSNVYIRLEANKKNGLGHLIRSYALSQIILKNFNVYFILSKKSIKIKGFLDKLNCDYFFIESDDWIFENISNFQILVIDCYEIKNIFRKKVKSFGKKIVTITDIEFDIDYSDVIINHSFGIKNSDFKNYKKIKIYSGFDYVLLRDNFFRFKKKELPSKIKKIFISFGGVDPFNLTLINLKILLSLNKNFKIDILTSNSNENLIHISNYISQLSLNQKKRIKIYRDLDAENIINVMRDCDIAVVPCSSILIEIIALGIPFICGYFIDNQISFYKNLYNSKIGNFIGDFRKKKLNSDHLDLSKYRFKEMCDLIDNKSNDRIKKIFNELC